MVVLEATGNIFRRASIGKPDATYAPKVAAGLSPGFQPWEPSK
jgi:hypothetical protein